MVNFSPKESWHINFEISTFFSKSQLLQESLEITELTMSKNIASKDPAEESRWQLAILLHF